MHQSALINATSFFQNYVTQGTDKVAIEIGAQDVNGSLRQIAPDGLKYIGVDFVQGKGVDVVLDDPYVLPFENESIDICLCSSVLEHSEMFWIVFLEVLRILKSDGLFYLNVPSNGDFHRYPVDCWRFYPDSGKALLRWAERNGYKPSLLESFVSSQVGTVWNDFVAVYVKDESHVNAYPNRILHTKKDFINGYVLNNDDLLNYSQFVEDQKKMLAIKQIIDNAIKVL